MTEESIQALVLMQPEFLQRLKDDELIRVCQVSIPIRRKCSTYLPQRALERFGVEISSERAVEDYVRVLTERGGVVSGSEKYIELEDALLRAIILNKSRLVILFNRMLDVKRGEYGCSSLSAALRLIGYGFIGDLASVKIMINRCSDDPRFASIARIAAMIAALERHDDVFNFIRDTYREVIIPNFSDLFLSAVDLRSMDMVRYALKNKDVIAEGEYRVDRAFLRAGNLLINFEDFDFLKELVRRYPQGIPPAPILLVSTAVGRNRLDVLDEYVDKSTFDEILSRELQAKRQDEVRALIKRYPTYIGYGSRFLLGPYILISSSLLGFGRTREIVEAFKDSQLEDITRLGMYLSGELFPAPEVENMIVREIQRSILGLYYFVALAEYDNVRAMRSISEKMDPERYKQILQAVLEVDAEIGENARDYIDSVLG